MVAGGARSAAACRTRGIRGRAACARLRRPRPRGAGLHRRRGRTRHGVHPDEGGRFDLQLPDFVWRDEVLVHLGALLRGYHDAAATFPWAGRSWCYEAREPVETICHNEVFPSNTVFRNGVPVAFIDWDTAAPGPRAWDLGWVAWRWVPFCRDEKC